MNILILMIEDKGEAGYILDIREIGGKTPEGENTFQVTYTTTGILTSDELGEETAFGLWGVYGISLNMLMINPGYAFFFSQMDLNVGEKMNFFGAGIIKVIGKEADDENNMLAEWVIDPDLALPLKSKIFEDGKLQGQIELTKYMEY